MKHAEKDHVGGLRMPRSRGAVSGLLLVLLGAWGALIPFVGPYFNFAYTPDQDWVWNPARGWLEVFPGVTTAVGGLLLIGSKNRASAMLGGWLAVLGGAWFIVGGEFAPMLRIGSVGDPVASTDRKRALLEISYFSGLGALIVFVGGVVLARLAVRLARDVAPEELPQPVVSVPAAESYVSAAEESTPEATPDALTTPRAEQHRQRAGAAAGSPDANYLRWPHPQ
ncbi:hypothetical protein [Mycobacterium haemophilum]|uniref:Secreted protein n=1 Tax=Mycobacterium haemophilum TaxID=29311 RepID=A0A0I9THD0_9MYCO|nr:hypothetical protein [Mycobacterium haemophilum]KLO27740.1 hypothetical protein ABH39_15275 [Mycobacterium haemophilum]KLO35247.1 hypothetical protein ABH38_16260 [Mycobacterium haemophilum]KLO40259.1 hypothetical protein ABH37_16375 [Mycobacterium haemophilum]KLO47533.1 hypothetical protein ABH36_16190 [Mycobacterium haemophilum]